MQSGPLGMMTTPKMLRFVLARMSEWSSRKAWGSIILTVQNGQIQFVSVNESFKPDQVPNE